MTKFREATERDHYWLEHETALTASGQTAKAYAAEHDLSLHAFYQARKRLRALGLSPPGDDRRRPVPAKRKPVAFSRIELALPRESGPDFRLNLPNGLVFEWSGSELPSPVMELLERLIQIR